MSAEEPPVVWVRSGVAADGETYIMELSVGDDQVATLDDNEAMAHAFEVFRVATTADYDSAVMRQWVSHMGVPAKEAAIIVADLRKMREPVNDAATKPLQLRPMCSVATLKPFIEIRMNDEAIGQWTPADARSHATSLCSAFAAVGLDNDYFGYLRTTVGSDATRAGGAVSDLANYFGEWD